jgi:hypothetical protein
MICFPLSGVGAACVGLKGGVTRVINGTPTPSLKNPLLITIGSHEVSGDSAIKGGPHATNVCYYDPARRIFGDSAKVRV